MTEPDIVRTDFEQIARALDAELDDSPAGLGGRFLGARLAIIVEQLRQVWNARGAADLAAYEARLRIDREENIDVDETIRSLDR